MSVQICARTDSKWWKRKFLYFISVLYCPVFLIMEPGKIWNQGQFFCLVHLPTTDKRHRALPVGQTSVWWSVGCSAILKYQGPASLPAGQALLAPGRLFQSRSIASRVLPARSSSLCWQRYFLSVIQLAWHLMCVHYVCVLWKPNVIAPDNILP